MAAGWRDLRVHGLFLREIGHANPSEPWKERSTDPVLTEGAGLLGTSMQVIAGRLDPDEQHVPFDMFTGSCGASAGKDLIE